MIETLISSKMRIKLLLKFGDAIDGEIVKLNVHAAHLRRKTSLFEILFVSIDPHNAARATLFHLDRVEAAVAADVEHGFAMQVLRQGL